MVRDAFNRFPDFLLYISICRRLLKIQYVIAIHLMRLLYTHLAYHNDSKIVKKDA